MLRPNLLSQPYQIELVKLTIRELDRIQHSKIVSLVIYSRCKHIEVSCRDKPEFFLTVTTSVYHA